MSDRVNRFLYLAHIGIPKSLEARFTELYDQEHVPNLMSVPGVHACSRYKLVWSDSAETAEYLAIYEVDAPDVPKSAAWKHASNQGEWPHAIRPFMTSRSHAMFEHVKRFEAR